MAELLNVGSGKPDNVPDTEVYKSLAAGTHTPTGGARALINPDGHLVFAPATDVDDNVSKYGYRIPTQDDLTAYANQQQYGEGTGNELKAFAAGTARGATFGGSDYLLPKTGITTRDALMSRKELNPAASIAGEITGAVGSAVLLPESLAGRVAEGGQLAGEAAAGLLGRGAAAVTAEGSLAAKVLQAGAEVGGKAAGSALEGSVYGLGQSVSEASLGEEDLNAEHVMANVGYGALWGGGLGAMLGAVVKAVPASLGKAQDVLANTYGKLLGTTEEMQGPLMAGVANRPEVWTPGVLSKAWAKVASAESGEAEEQILKAMREGRTPTGDLMTPDQRGKFAKDAADSLQEHYRAVDKAAKDASSLARPQETAQLLTDTNAALALDELQATRQVLRHAIEEMKAAPELYPGRFPAKIEQIAEALDSKTMLPEAEAARHYTAGNRANARIQTVPDLTAAEAFAAINEAKQAIDTKIPWGKEISGEAADAIGLIKGLRSTIKDSLEKETVWGQAGARQAGYNNAVSDFLTAKTEFQRRFMYKVKTKSGGVSYKIDPIKVNTWFNQINDPRGLRSTEALSDYLSTSRTLVKEIGKTYEAAPFEDFDTAGMQRLIERNEETATRAANIVQKQPGGHGFFTDLYSGAKAAAWYGAMGPMGLLANGASSAFSAINNPGAAIQRLVRLENAIQKSTTLLNRAAKTAVEVGREATKGIPGAGMLGQKMAPEDRQTRFKKRSEEIQDRQSNPEHLMDKLELTTRDGYHAAPKMMGGIQQAALQGTIFLSSKIPQPPGPELPLDAPFVPSQAQVVTFDRYYDAVHDPVSVLHQLKDNIVLPEAVEAVQAVYPRLYAEMKQGVMNSIIDIRAKKDSMIPYQKRLALGKFLGQPLDTSFTPQSVASNQATLNQQQAQNQEQAAPGASTITVASRTMTPMQRAERRNS